MKQPSRKLTTALVKARRAYLFFSKEKIFTLFLIYICLQLSYGFIQISYFIIFNEIREITKGWGSLSVQIYLFSTREQHHGF